MKYTLLLALLILLYTPHASAQSVIYYDHGTGSIGYAYSNDEDGHDIKQLEKQALSNCEQHGGTRCTMLYETNKLGWSGILVGRDQHANPIVLGVGHQLSDTYAKAELERKYLFRDGIQYDDVIILTWKAD